MRRIIVLSATLLAVAAVALAGLRLWEAASAYSGARQEGVALLDYTEYSLQDLSNEDLVQVEQHLRGASSDLDRLHEATGIPILGDVVEHAPWIGPRYEAQRQAITVARLATEAGQSLAELLLDVRQNLPAEPDTCLPAVDGEIVLLLLAERQPELRAIAATVAEARRVERDIDDAHLSAQARRQLDDVRRNLERFEQLDRSVRDLVASGASLDVQLLARAARFPVDSSGMCPGSDPEIPAP